MIKSSGQALLHSSIRNDDGDNLEMRNGKKIKKQCNAESAKSATFSRVLLREMERDEVVTLSGSR